MTFAQFEALISNSLLNKGESITISDFATSYYLVGTHEGSFAHLLDEGQPVIKTGATEPLTVYATSNNSINIVAKSTVHPNDEIYYDWNPANWLNNLNFSTDGENIVDGFKGVIYFRRDKLLNNQTNHDYRNVVNRLHSIAQTAWVEGAYNEGDFVQHTPTDGTLGIYVATGAVTTEEPGVDAVWRKVIGIDESSDRGSYLSFDDSLFYVGNYGIPIIDATDFEEREWLGEGCYNCNVSQYILKGYGGGGKDVLIPLIVFGNNCGNISYGNGCGNISYANGCGSISYGNDCGNISYGNSCGNISYGNSCRNIFCKESIQNVDAVSLALDLTGSENKEFTTNASGNVLMLYYDASNVLQVVDLSTL